MRFAACNELVHDRPFAEACERIARHGFRGIALAPYSLAEDPLRIPTGRVRSGFSAAFRALAAAGDTGWVSLETFHAADSPAAVLTETRAFLDNMASAIREGASARPEAPSRGGR
jgi:sugar phosphate isomerase/epimerase